MTGDTTSDGGDDDRLLLATRVLALIIVPVLVAAFTVLFGFPDRTEDLWAWTIRPDLAALIMGGAYLAGAWFFTRGLLVGRWHRVAVGWLAVIPFTTLLGVATFIHWDRFNHDHVSFWAWLVLYTATPIALPILWLRNQKAAGIPPATPGAELPKPLRMVIAFSGGALMVAAVVSFIRPATALDRWPWALTPLTARTLASFAAFLAVVWLAFAFTGEWTRLAIPFEAASLGLVVVVLAVLLGRHDLAGGQRTASSVCSSACCRRFSGRPGLGRPEAPHRPPPVGVRRKAVGPADAADQLTVGVGRRPRSRTLVAAWVNALPSASWSGRLVCSPRRACTHSRGRSVAIGGPVRRSG